jgi:hypothetical protein
MVAPAKARGFHGLGGGEGQMRRPDFPNPRRAHEEDGKLNREALADLGDAVVPDGIARNVDRAVRGFCQRQHESNHRTTISARRPMPRGCPSHPQNATVLGRQVDALPGGKADGMIAQSFGACRRGQNHPRTLEENAPRIIKIIKVLVVAEQDGIDAAKGLGAKRGTTRFPQRIHPGWIFGTRRIKRWIRQQPQPAPFEQGGRSADMGERQLIIPHDLNSLGRLADQRTALGAAAGQPSARRSCRRGAGRYPRSSCADMLQTKPYARHPSLVATT